MLFLLLAAGLLVFPALGPFLSATRRESDETEVPGKDA